MNNLTFVTAFLDLRENRDQYRTNEQHFQHFQKLIQTNIPLLCFINPEAITDAIKRENVTYIPTQLEDLWTYKATKKIASLRLPKNRNQIKDTEAFLILMNAKIEFLQKATQHKKTTHYAWIDFSIFHVFHNPEKASATLRSLSQSVFPEKVLYIPGCYQVPCRINDSCFFEQILWRFCGGFLLADKNTIQEFTLIYQTFFPLLLEQFGLTWEVNLWAYFENKSFIQTNWFLADHNESMIQLPASFQK